MTDITLTIGRYQFKSYTKEQYQYLYIKDTVLNPNTYHKLTIRWGLDLLSKTMVKEEWERMDNEVIVDILMKVYKGKVTGELLKIPYHKEPPEYITIPNEVIYTLDQIRNELYSLLVTQPDYFLQLATNYFVGSEVSNLSDLSCFKNYGS